MPGTKLSPLMQELIDKGLFDRLPVTFTTYFYDRVKNWELLFPAERNYFERLFRLLDRSSSEEVTRLFAPLRDLEVRMGVNEKSWPRREFTLAHVDFLNRSPHYAAWRGVIADIFGQLDPLLDAEVARSGRRRLALILSPAELPVGPDRMWLRLRGRGKRIPLDLSPVPTGDFLTVLLSGPPNAEKNLLQEYASARASSPYDIWLVEAGDRLWPRTNAGVRLSHAALSQYRARLMEEVRKGIEERRVQGPRQLGEMLRQIDVKTEIPWIDRDPLLADFTKSVLLNGNGTLLLNNTFVEWATLQAARRARPSLVVVSFGVRNKIKPFTNVLIYVDQERASPIPSQMDTLGSYVDLEVFYSYLLEGFEKYAEYRRNSAFLLVGEAMDEMLLIAPSDFPLTSADAPVALAEVHAACRSWLAL